MLLPIRTNIRLNKTPYINYALIVVNVFIFLLSYHPHIVNYGWGQQVMEVLRPWAQNGVLDPKPKLFQFITYAFLHASWMHIFANMFFLFIFGNNVNDKLGNVGYLVFYIAAAIFSGIGHVIFSNSPVLGASGAVAGVTGAFLVLFPQTLITVVYWFLIIGTIEVPALWFIGIKLIFIDNIIAPNYHGGQVAYDAHIAGYAFGIISTMVLLATKRLPSTGLDLFTMLRQWNRRRVYRDIVSDGSDPFMGIKSKRIHAKVRKSDAEIEREEKIAKLRTDISFRINEHNLPEAARLYLELEEIDPSQILPKQYLLDIANQLMSAGEWMQSSNAYEKFINAYPKYEYPEQIYLMLGVLNSRYVNDHDKAIKYLRMAEERLYDPAQKQMCRDELDKLIG